MQLALCSHAAQHVVLLSVSVNLLAGVCMRLLHLANLNAYHPQTPRLQKACPCFWILTQCDTAALQVTEMVQKAREKQEAEARQAVEREEHVRPDMADLCILLGWSWALTGTGFLMCSSKSQYLPVVMIASQHGVAQVRPAVMSCYTQIMPV